MIPFSTKILKNLHALITGSDIFFKLFYNKFITILKIKFYLQFLFDWLY